MDDQKEKKKGGGGLLYRREKVLKAVWLAVVCGGVTGLERLSLGRWLGDCGLIRRCSRGSSQMSGQTTLAVQCCREKACDAIEYFFVPVLKWICAISPISEVSWPSDLKLCMMSFQCALRIVVACFLKLRNNLLIWLTRHLSFNRCVMISNGFLFPSKFSVYNYKGKNHLKSNRDHYDQSLWKNIVCTLSRHGTIWTFHVKIVLAKMIMKYERFSNKIYLKVLKSH